MDGVRAIQKPVDGQKLYFSMKLLNIDFLFLRGFPFLRGVQPSLEFNIVVMIFKESEI